MSKKAIFLASYLFANTFILSSLMAEATAPVVNRHVKGEFIVRFKPSIAGAEVRSHLKLIGIRSRATHNISRTRLVVSDNKDITPEELLTKLGRDKVEFVERNQIYRLSKTPKDSLYRQQWALKNYGQKGGVKGMDIGAEVAWNTTTGAKEIIVAVLDSGVDYKHKDLKANIWINTLEKPGNNRDDDRNGVVDDYYGFSAFKPYNNPLDRNSHGTHVAGIIGASANSTGVVGVNWNVKILPLRFMNSGGEGTLSNAIRALDYAYKLRLRGEQIRVINNSWGGEGDYSKALDLAMSRLAKVGVSMVFAAGNDGANNDRLEDYPTTCTDPHCITVASVNRNGKLSKFSNFGQQTVLLAAPGEDIMSTVPNDRYRSYSGTSMAAPFVSGIAALVLAKDPAISPALLKYRLASSARPLSTLTGRVTTAGMVNASGAISGKPFKSTTTRTSRVYTK